MSEPEDENNPQENNDDLNKEELHDQFQDKPSEVPSFMSGCFTFGALNIIIILAIVLPQVGNRFLSLPTYLPLLIIIIVNSFSSYYFYVAGKKGFAYGIITVTIFILLLTGSCLFK